MSELEMSELDQTGRTLQLIVTLAFVSAIVLGVADCMNDKDSQYFERRVYETCLQGCNENAKGEHFVKCVETCSVNLSPNIENE